MKRNKWSKVLLGAALSAALIAGAQTEARAERKNRSAFRQRRKQFLIPLVV